MKYPDGGNSGVWIMYLEKLCVVDADAISHFDSVPSLKALSKQI